MVVLFNGILYCTGWLVHALRGTLTVMDRKEMEEELGITLPEPSFDFIFEDKQKSYVHWCHEGSQLTGLTPLVLPS